MISLIKLQTVYLLFKWKNFHSVAHYLNTNQATVSKRISSLEEELGKTLFIRTPTETIPTEFCKILLPDISKILETVAQIENKKNDDNENDLTFIKVGCIATFAHSWLYKWIRAIEDKYNNIELDIIIDTSSVLEKMLMNGEIDIAFLVSDLALSKKSKQYLSVDLYSTTPIFVANKKTASQNNIWTIQDFSNTTLIMFRRSSKPFKELIRIFNNNGVKIPKIHTTTSMKVMIDLARHNNIIALITPDSIEREVKNKELIILNTNFSLPILRYSAKYNANFNFYNLNNLIKLVNKVLSD